MTEATNRSPGRSDARVLVLSLTFAPCPEVGGKRFAFLSKYLSRSCAEYQVVARRNRSPVDDATPFSGSIHRVGMFPSFTRGKKTGMSRIWTRAWIRWLCLVDPFSGWVIPAILKSLQLDRKYRFNVVIVTVPFFSALIAGTIVSMFTGSKLIIDYRDPWTNHRSDFPKPFGRWLCPAIERWAIRQSHSIVFCTDIMRDRFIDAFGDIAPPRLQVIYNGFEGFEDSPTGATGRATRTVMLYAGLFYGARNLLTIAPALAGMLRSGEISADSFQFLVYTRLKDADRAVIEEYGLYDLIRIEPPAPYREIRKIMAQADILFLPSGDDVLYAVPFKFFDYLAARRPILAVAPGDSSVARLMRSVDCGEFAEFGDSDDIARALRVLLGGERTYTFAGAERFLWTSVAGEYREVIENALPAAPVPASAV